MEGFDAIYYEEEIENNEEAVPTDISLVPDPVIIRGAGNMTVYEIIYKCHVYQRC